MFFVRLPKKFVVLQMSHVELHSLLLSISKACRFPERCAATPTSYLTRRDDLQAALLKALRLKHSHHDRAVCSFHLSCVCSVDLPSRISESGGLANGTMTAGHFASCLVKYFPRIHFSQQAMAMLIGSYACGYSGTPQHTLSPAREGRQSVAWQEATPTSYLLPPTAYRLPPTSYLLPLCVSGTAPRESGSKAPTQVAWHDFVHDVNAAPQLHPDDFVAIASRRQAEVWLASASVSASVSTSASASASASAPASASACTCCCIHIPLTHSSTYLVMCLTHPITFTTGDKVATVRPVALNIVPPGLFLRCT